MEYKVDFHIHSRYSSDGTMTVKKVFDQALKKGLGAIAIADHNVFDGSYEALSAERNDLLVIPAVEVSTTKGHMLCYFISKGPAEAQLKKTKGLYSFDEVRSFVGEENGLLFAAHPYRKKILKIGDILHLLDGIEIFNGRNTAKRQTANDFARILAADRELSFTAGSDAHLAAEVGKAYRLFRFDTLPTKQDIYNEMQVKQGAYFGSYSPLVYEGICALRHDIKKKNGKQTTKDLLKIALGCVIDPLAGLRFDTREIHRGKIYQMPGRSDPEMEIR